MFEKSSDFQEESQISGRSSNSFIGKAESNAGGLLRRLAMVDSVRRISCDDNVGVLWSSRKSERITYSSSNDRKDDEVSFNDVDKVLQAFIASRILSRESENFEEILEVLQTFGRIRFQICNNIMT